MKPCTYGVEGREEVSRNVAACFGLYFSLVSTPARVTRTAFVRNISIRNRMVIGLQSSFRTQVDAS